ncbi:MAG: LamG-like jellyroll fold domain-containing protein [Bacteroidota bacterium]
MKTKTILVIAALCFTSVFFSQIPNYVPLNGLQGYWPFTGNANDLSGNNYNGTVNGASLTMDRFGSAGKAYSFNGSTNYILTNYAGILGANPRAVSFWAKNTQLTSPLYLVTWGSNQTGSRFGVGFSSSPAGIGVGGASSEIVYSTPTPVSNGVWHHYVVQFSGTKLSDVKIYQDAALLTQTIIANTANTLINTLSAFNVQFGRVDYTPQPQYYAGDLDEFGIWNRTLTICEIEQLYRSALNTVTVASSNSTICPGQSTSLNATGSNTYTWNTLSNNANIVVTPAITTTYTASGTSSLGCVTTSTIIVNVVSCTGIEAAVSLNTHIGVSPNPTNGPFSISGIDPFSRLEIYDALGNLVYKTLAKTEKTEINLSEQAKGIYFIKIINGTGLVTRKIVRD